MRPFGRSSGVAMRGILALSIVLAFSAAPAAAWSPRKREPEPKPRDCPELGEGFVRLPGADTCVRLGGLVRVEGARVGGSR